MQDCDPSSRLTTCTASPLLGANVTGLSNLSSDLGSKRVELLREVVPGLRRLAIVTNLGNPSAVLEIGEVQAAARTFGLEVITQEIRRDEDIAPAFEAVKGRAEAPYIVVDPFGVRISTMAVSARLPTQRRRPFGITSKRRVDILWAELPGRVPARRGLRRQNPPMVPTRRSAGRAAHQVPADRQHEGCQETRPHHP
jgi:hypothetical protein